MHNFFTLLSTYVNDFNELNIKEKLSSMNPEKSFFIFAPNDYWVPQEVMNHLPENSKFHVCKNISHDFCLYEDQYKEVSRLVNRKNLNKISS